MIQPDYEGAKRYALERLQRDLSPDLTYHSISHTRDDVVPAAAYLAALEGFEGEDVMLLVTAAWFHDLGYIEQHQDNEWIAVRIAEDVLPGLGFSPAQLDVIRGIIMATRLPQSPQTPLEMVIADADLTSLGSSDFFARQRDLRQEFAMQGMTFTDEEWYRYELAFLGKHQYFTASARRLYSAQKAANIAALEELLEKSRG